jgi:predicted nucleic acid-binding protein
VIVLDAALVIDWLTERQPPVSPETHEALIREPLVVPSHWPMEIGNALRADLEAATVSVQDIDRICEQLEILEVQVQRPHALGETGALAGFAARHKLSTYDAAYVQLALENRATLATLNRDMRAAASALNIPLLPSAAR